MINPILQEEITYTRSQVQTIFGVKSRSTLNAYCNFLRIPRRIRQFNEAQYKELMTLRDWVSEGNAISDFCRPDQAQDNCA
jgi:hypothetical protein